MSAWWTEKREERYIEQLENEDTHVTNLYGMKDEDGQWRYAIVRWVHLHPTVLLEFKEGKVVQ